MPRLVLSALAISLALSVPAVAAPLSLTPERYGDSISPDQNVRPYQAEQTIRPQHVAARRSELGGGFLEFLFGGFRGGPAPSQAEPTYGAPQGDAASYAIDPKYERQEVLYGGNEAPGTIVIDTPHRFLYLIEPSGRALRYGIGVGRPGFAWAGVHHITAKREWPDWTPPPQMLRRLPGLPRHMPGGPENPLGARAMYLGSTLYRIHGSNEPWTIGHAVSSGCIRLRNQDVIDLYNRVRVGTKVVVI